MNAVVDDVRTFNAATLPSGWRAVTLANIVGSEGVFVDGDWVESKDQDPEGDVRLIQLADVGDGEYRDRSERFLTSQKARELSCTFLEPGDLLVARMPDPLGRACIFPGDRRRAVTVVDVAVVRPRHREVNLRWLMYCINAPQFRRVVASLQSGSTRQRISRKNLAKIVFPLPPLCVQDDVVAEIEKQFSRLDEAVANLKRAKTKLKRYKAAVLKAAVEGRLVPREAEIARREGRSYETGAQLLQRILETRRSLWKGKHKEPVPPDTVGLPILPEGWTWASLDSLSWDSGYGTSEKCTYENSGPAVLRIPNVKNGMLDLQDLKYAPTDFALSSADAIDEGDMLVIRTNGSKSLIGRAAVALSTPANAIAYASYLIRFRLARMEELPAWVALVWQTTRIRSWIESRAATSAGQHNTSQSVLATAAISVPPYAEQHHIVAEVDRRLSVVREVDLQVDASYKHAQALRQTILAAAFGTGS